MPIARVGLDRAYRNPVRDVRGCGARSVQTVETAAQQLADAYAPIAMLREQGHPLRQRRRRLFSAPVDWIFDNPELLLRADAGGDVAYDPVLAEGFAPPTSPLPDPEPTSTSRTIPITPGCDYETTSRTVTATFDLKPTTYVHIVVDAGKRKLYLQYWFWYLFNDWNNLHESDWEMVQLVFDATTRRTRSPFGPDELDSPNTRRSARPLEQQPARDRDEPISTSIPVPVHTRPIRPRSLYQLGRARQRLWLRQHHPPGPQLPWGPAWLSSLSGRSNRPFAWALFQGRWGQRGEPLFNGPLGPN